MTTPAARSADSGSEGEQRDAGAAADVQALCRNLKKESDDEFKYSCGDCCGGMPVRQGQDGDALAEADCFGDIGRGLCGIWSQPGDQNWQRGGCGLGHGDLFVRCRLFRRTDAGRHRRRRALYRQQHDLFCLGSEKKLLLGRFALQLERGLCRQFCRFAASGLHHLPQRLLAGG
ncbi:MAG: hypothetical protein BWY77_00532 [bacterium ADurb.Bin431]|nr:MAG: hypothetical protein BWY77_00532 [bacterium ADurb.Bin431]